MRKSFLRSTSTLVESVNSVNNDSEFRAQVIAEKRDISWTLLERVRIIAANSKAGKEGRKVFDYRVERAVNIGF